MGELEAFGRWEESRHDEVRRGVKFERRLVSRERRMRETQENWDLNQR